ncbi:MAG: tyrosine-type recombinase/integrase [Opitutales bacterium]|nr:tyrosine-type recombinase/integrase [Opitutales bacterium]
MSTEDSFNIRVSRALVAQALSAEQTLEKTEIGVLDAARLVKELSELGRTKKLNQLRRIFRIGVDVFSREHRTPTFCAAFTHFLAAKSHLRARSLCDYRQMYGAILKKFPELFSQKIHTFTAPKCGEILDNVFQTSRQRHKARAILHSFFGYCVRHAWCAENPVTATDSPILKEREITPLSLAEIAAIFRAARGLGLGACVPAIALMLFAGIRPREVERLCWGDIDWEEKVISILPTHSKTGGSRHVNIFPVLEKILRERRRVFSDPICPPNWRRKWKRIRRAAGWRFPEKPWQQDVLRHTFASYHLKFFKNLPQLQCEMGHASLRLLRTRYLSMRGVTLAAAEAFWRGEGIF